MTIQTWPASLPRPERSTWQRSSQDARRKRTPSAGSPSYRRRYSNAALVVSLSVVLTRQLKAEFDQFYHEACQEGASLFWMPDPTTDGWPMLTSQGEPMMTADGKPLLLSAQWLCAWGDDLPVETVEGQIEFRKTFSVVVVPS